MKIKMKKKVSDKHISEINEKYLKEIQEDF